MAYILVAAMKEKDVEDCFAYYQGGMWKEMQLKFQSSILASSLFP